LVFHVRCAKHWEFITTAPMSSQVWVLPSASFRYLEPLLPLFLYLRRRFHRFTIAASAKAWLSEGSDHRVLSDNGRSDIFVHRWVLLRHSDSGWGLLAVLATGSLSTYSRVLEHHRNWDATSALVIACAQGRACMYASGAA
jgi:hypothetical protein